MLSVLEEVQLWNLVVYRGGLGAALLPESLSHSERQFLVMIRSSLRNRHYRQRSVLVLDTTTSNLDRDIEALMQDIITKKFKGQTVVYVAHKLKTLKNCDAVVVLDKGKVEHTGPAEAVLKSSP
jgi:ABC-type multidrug transport system fused ATPase/permease subunit